MATLISSIPLESLRILAIDDEAFNLEILSEWLTDQGINVATAGNGREALLALATAEQPFDAILLDRMMPEMDGMEFLRVFNTQARWRHTPVIMQSAAATVDEVQAALDSGIWYYLSKPFERRKLLAMIQTAVSDSRSHAQLRGLVKRANPPGGDRPLEVSTPQQALEAAVSFAALSPEPQSTVIGLYELLLNAVEHGNLEIDYHEKTRLLNEQRWQAEIEARLRRAPYEGRIATVTAHDTPQGIAYSISDQGKGFKNKPYLQMQTHRAADSHGRGIAFAGRHFASLEFQGTGNQVCAIARGNSA